jgi:hypothetical protein
MAKGALFGGTAKTSFCRLYGAERWLQAIRRPVLGVGISRRWLAVQQKTFPSVY